ncbi:cellulase family glycosylhydrolase [Sedimentisphaera salicampi]|uniref:cellulase family glycosylhydrolase n=1 Tax=Sedimentisphaera salicampi TaxID=1941349 RepID=UPI000B9B4E70|nr:cellulase family glycosylhydrolase [Sedimentisphaera salicampi]OXU16105.1 Endo-beta-mannanase [Sedimentisphaera salicampi]
MTKKITAITLLSLMVFCFAAEAGNSQWSVEKAKQWYSKQPWMVGCNFLPSTAINQIEMWQELTWDPETIDKELGWAQELGFNTVRVYLHDLVYEHEKEGFIKRIDEFLDICQKHGMRPLFVFFDDCHWAWPHMGVQPKPVPGVHNSGWKHSPGWFTTKAYEKGTVSKTEKKKLEDYIKTILTEFSDDKRILGWDLYNEPGRSGNKPIKLLKDTWQWAWDVRPSQPLTACVNGCANDQAKRINAKNSDIYSFHSYHNPKGTQKQIEFAKKDSSGRPIFCTEYMARTKGSTFQNCLPVFKEEKISCWNWGLVDGKSGTKWPWSSRTRDRGGQIRPVPSSDPDNAPSDPPVWFHDIFRKDGTPYRQAEVDFIKKFLKAD